MNLSSCQALNLLYKGVFNAFGTRGLPWWGRSSDISQSKNSRVLVASRETLYGNQNKCLAIFVISVKYLLVKRGRWLIYCPSQKNRNYISRNCGIHLTTKVFLVNVSTVLRGFKWGKIVFRTKYFQRYHALKIPISSIVFSKPWPGDKKSVP